MEGLHEDKRLVTFQLCTNEAMDAFTQRPNPTFQKAPDVDPIDKTRNISVIHYSKPLTKQDNEKYIKKGLSTFCHKSCTYCTSFIERN